jgi:UDP-N-acetylmuramate dehydrogenase
VIKKDVSLKAFNTFGIDVHTRQLVSIDSLSTLIEVLENLRNTPFRILGGGSNILLTENYEGTTLLMHTKGIEILEENEQEVLVQVQAGENWHDFVSWCLDNNYGGVENLVLIPGSVGAAPIQNIGAYGVELQSVFHSCDVLDIQTLSLSNYSKEHCEFGYRTSLFKTVLKNKCIITQIQFKLQKPPHQLQLSYGVIKEKLHDKTQNIQSVAQAVSSIRRSKLPDPKEIGNSGSFFKNPIIAHSHLMDLQNQHPQIPHYPINTHSVKVPAGWLIESLGLKGIRKGDAGVHQKQALVLVNYGSASGKEILDLAKEIQKQVWDTYRISLKTEVNIL